MISFTPGVKVFLAQSKHCVKFLIHAVKIQIHAP